LFPGSEDFESGWGGWYSDFGIWEIGEPTTGPGGAFSGLNCAATKLAGNYPFGPDSRLISPEMDLPTAGPQEEVLLRFREFWRYASSSDRGDVQISVFDGTTWSAWTTIDTRNTYSQIWHHERVDLTAYAGQRVRIAFFHVDVYEDTNPSGGYHHYEDAGWYLDEVEIVLQTIPLFPGSEDFESGWGGWYSDFGIWEIGEPTTGPGGAFSGLNCAATKLAG
ncbi:MAG: hypothetical protein GY847_29635, partial [Proteobacteria bacterium]|nr:hypothetical protein [Pseudomonadota bacterium]